MPHGRCLVSYSDVEGGHLHVPLLQFSKKLTTQAGRIWRHSCTAALLTNGQLSIPRWRRRAQCRTMSRKPASVMGVLQTSSSRRRGRDAVILETISSPMAQPEMFRDDTAQHWHMSKSLEAAAGSSTFSKLSAVRF